MKKHHPPLPGSATATARPVASAGNHTVFAGGYRLDGEVLDGLSDELRGITAGLKVAHLALLSLGHLDPGAPSSALRPGCALDTVLYDLAGRLNDLQRVVDGIGSEVR